jgi:receptor expression-enhancing protein 5/6
LYGLIAYTHTLFYLSLSTITTTTQLLITVQDKTKVPKEFIVLGGGFLISLFVVFGVGVASLSSLVGFLYPAFKSFQAIETKNKGDDTQWLVYWVIFAFFSIIEVFVDILLYWIPFYYAFKLAFLLWAMLPQTKGAKFLYDAFLKDFLKKNESRIDAAMADAKKNAGSIASELSSATSDLVGAAAASDESKKDE